MKKVLLEGLLVAVIGSALAFLANALSPRGLELSRDYFGATAKPPPPPGTNAVAFPHPTNAPSPLEVLSVRLKAKGLQLAGSNQVLQLYRDPRCQQDLVTFIDARNDEHYQAGHVPGAHLFDYYHPANYLSNVLQACQLAQEIVVYCNGGDCEDSELAATMLRDLGIPTQKLLVYGGGMTEWNTNGWPVEIGPRKSGKLRTGSK